MLKALVCVGKEAFDLACISNVSGNGKTAYTSIEDKEWSRHESVGTQSQYG